METNYFVLTFEYSEVKGALSILEREVNFNIKKGFKPLGGVSIVAEKMKTKDFDEKGFPYSNYIVSQAMVSE